MRELLTRKMLQIAVTKDQLLGSYLAPVGFEQLFNGHGSTKLWGLLTSYKVAITVMKELKCSSFMVGLEEYQILESYAVWLYNVLHSKIHYCHGYALK